MVTGLLLGVAILAILSQSIVSGQGQGNSIITNVTTLTTQVTSYVYSSYTIGETTATTTVTQSPVNIYSGTFSMSPSGLGSQYGCYTDYVSFNATQGQYVSGTFSSDQPVEFAVINNLASWTYCEAPPPSIAGPAGTVRAYSFYAMIPQSGLWYLAFVLGIYLTAHINLTATLSRGSTSYTETLPIVSTALYSQTFTSSVAEISTSLVPASAVLGLTDGSFIALAVIVIGILALLTAYLILKSRTTHKPKQATPSQFVKVPSSCIKCGAELPSASDFCNRCGTKQTG
jgi:hypothetical protein